MRASSVILAIAVLGAAAGTASAQGRGRNKNNDNVPPGHRPPAGMCRIWINGVPAERQPISNRFPSRKPDRVVFKNCARRGVSRQRLGERLARPINLR